MSANLETKIRVLAISVLLTDIAAERWEKGQEDPNWVSRNENGQFSKSPTSDNLNISSSIEKARKAFQNILDFGEQKFADNKNWQSISKILKQPIYTELLKSASLKLSNIDQELSESFDRFSKYAINAIEESKSFANYVKDVFSKQVDIVESSPKAKQIIKNIGIVLAVGTAISLCLYANGLMDAGLIAAKVSPDLAKSIGALIRVPLYYQVYTKAIVPIIDSLSKWAKYDKQKNPVIDQAVKILDRSLKEQLTKDVAKASKLLKISEEEADSVIAAVTSLNIDPDKLVESLERIKLQKYAIQQRNNIFLRVKELPKLLVDRAKTEAESPEQKELDNSLIWHKGIIEAEIKYGSAIDKLANATLNKESITKAYLQLLKLAQKKEGREYNKATSRQVDDFAKLRGFINKPEGNLAKQAEKRVETVVKLSKVFDSLIYPTLDVAIGSASTNPGGFVTTDVIFQDGLVPKSQLAGFQKIMGGENKVFLNVGTKLDPAVIGYHELGHALELKNSLVNISGNYLKSRTMSDGKTTDFMWDYSAKTYTNVNNHLVATEVLSTGTQKLASPYHLHDFANKDRDHLLYTFYALDTKL